MAQEHTFAHTNVATIYSQLNRSTASCSFADKLFTTDLYTQCLINGIHGLQDSCSTRALKQFRYSFSDDAQAGACTECFLTGSTACIALYACNSVPYIFGMPFCGLIGMGATSTAVGCVGGYVGNRSSMHARRVYRIVDEIITNREQLHELRARKALELHRQERAAQQENAQEAPQPVVMTTTGITQRRPAVSFASTEQVIEYHQD